jgi:hypothetical protein
MIQKLRNQGLLRVGIGLGAMLLGFHFGMLLHRTPARNLGFALFVILAIGGTLLYYFGMADLLKAKGYSGSIVAAIILLGLCIPVVSALVMTPVVLFALKDKNVRYQSRSSRPHTQETVSCVLGWLLSIAGGFMAIGFLLFESQRVVSLLFPTADGSFSRPFWIDAVTILDAGVLPLCAGILFVQMRYDLLKKAMRLICVIFTALFMFSCIAHFVLPDIAASQFGILAASGLTGGIISSILWVTARTLEVSAARSKKIQERPRASAGKHGNAG